MIYSLDGLEGKGKDIPIYRRSHPGASGYINHRSRGRIIESGENREKGEERKKVSKIHQEPDTNTDYSRGKGFARSTYPKVFALYTPCTAIPGGGAAESNHASRFPENFRGGSLISETCIVLSLSSESKEAIETMEETEEAGD
jgi:hypothetical protein